MLALAATDAVGAILFGVLYAVAGAGLMSQGSFLACLGLLFALVTTLWVQAETRQRGQPPLRRVGRVVAGLALALVATPGMVLMPLFWLDGQLDPHDALRRLLPTAMAVTLIALVLVVLVNAVGLLVIGGRAVLGGARQPSR